MSSIRHGALEAAPGDLPARARRVHSSIVLPMNDRFENWATEVTGRPKAAWSPPGQMTPELIRQIFHGLTPGFAVHDLPLVRTFLPDWRRTRGVVSSSTGALCLPRRRSRRRPRLAIDLNHAWARRSLLRSRGGDRRRGAAHPLHALRCSRRISLCDRDRRAGYGPAVRSVLPKRPVRSTQWVRTADS